MDQPKTKILIAEDEQDIGRLVKFTLERQGYDTELVADGEQAVAKANEIMPDLILLDVMMPVMNGYEACEIIKNAAATKDIPVVMLSAKAQKAEIQAGFDHGAIDYIPKPFTPKTLADKIAEVLKNARD